VWFVYVAVGLALLIVSGIYVRRRIATALTLFGIQPRAIRIVRWLIVWLLFGYPILLVVSIATSLALGRATLPRFDGMATSMLLAVPFMWAVLVVLQSLPWVIAIDVANRFVRRERLRAAAILTIVAVFAIYTPVRILVERGDVRVRQHIIGAGTQPFRIAFVADMQQDVHTDGDRAREIYAILNESKPDVVLSGGDWINAGPDHIEAAAEAAATLKSRLGTFSVRGDHEHFAYVDRDRSVGEIERAMEARGIAMLNNEVRWFDHAGKRIGVLFLNYNYIVRTDDTAVALLVESLKGADYSIVVTHQLDRTLAALLENKVNLVLAAHTHGGQINPVVGFMHVKLARLETRFIDGRYALGSTDVIVTAGVGYSIVPLRYAAPGSIEVIDLRL
jgi:predicted MPP superfamily phosphohydrolase